MKHILLTSIAAALCTLPVLGEVEKKSSSASSYSVVTSDGKGTGKAIVTVEVNGKKETREIDLGSGETKIEISSDGIKPGKGKNIVWLGISLEDLPAAVAAQLPTEAEKGVLVSNVASDSPAAIAGLLKNDVVTKVDDQAVTNPKQLKELIASHKEGDSVRVSYFRRGQKFEVETKLASRFEAESPDTKVATANGFGGIQQMLKSLGSGLTIDKEVIVVDKDGHVVSRDKKDVSEKIEREMVRIREQLEVAQERATEAAKRAEEAARAATEAVRKSLEK